MKVWGCTIPMAGHLYIEVEAETEDEAIDKDMDNASIGDLEDWEQLMQFNKGNICYCPHPWEAVAEDLGEVE